MPQFNLNRYVEVLQLSSVNEKTDVQLRVNDRSRLSTLTIMNAFAFAHLQKHLVYEQIRTVRFSHAISGVYIIDPKVFVSIFPRLGSLGIAVYSRNELRQ